MKEKINIIIDTREQTPFSFPYWLATTKRATLLTGDYALENDNQFCIERKSLNDFVGTVAGGWERFEREIKRMNNDNFISKVIIIEGTLKDFCYSLENNKIQLPKYNSFKITPQFLIMRMAELILGNINIVFANDNALGSAICFALLKKRYLKLGGDLKLLRENLK